MRHAGDPLQVDGDLWRPPVTDAGIPSEKDNTWRYHLQGPHAMPYKSDLKSFLIDCQSPLLLTEIRLHCEGAYPTSASKSITNKLEEENSQQEFTLQHFSEDCQVLGF